MEVKINCAPAATQGNVILIDSVLLPTAAPVQAPPASEPRGVQQTTEEVRAATDADVRRTLTLTPLNTQNLET